MKKIVTIGGGSGQYTLLSGLRDIKNINITAIVSMADSGGSTGRLRDELGVLPPGDVLQCLVALSANREKYRELLMKRFKSKGKLRGHSAGNMLLTFISEYMKDFPAASLALGELLDTRGRVLPVTTSQVNLVADLADGRKIFGETNIDVCKEKKRPPIKKVRLVSNENTKIKAYVGAIKAIKEADTIIIGPGDIFSSILPNLIVPGVSAAIKRSKAKIIYVVNIMTKRGESDGFCGNDFVSLIEKSINRKVDYIVSNTACPSDQVLKKYRKARAMFILPPVIKENSNQKVIHADLINIEGDLARHDANKLKQTVKNIL